MGGKPGRRRKSRKKAFETSSKSLDQRLLVEPLYVLFINLRVFLVCVEGAEGVVIDDREEYVQHIRVDERIGGLPEVKHEVDVLLLQNDVEEMLPVCDQEVLLNNLY